MGVAILAAALALISFAFVRWAMVFVRYYKKITDTNNNTGLDYRNNYLKWYFYLKYALPIIIFGLYFNAMAAAIGAIYVIARWLSD